MAELLTYIVLAVVLGVVFSFAIRSVRRANAVAPPEARRSSSQRTLNTAAALALLPALAYFAFVSPSLFSAYFALSLTFVVVMLALRLAGIPWRTRLFVVPVASALAVFVGALWTTWPSGEPSALAAQTWVAFSLVAVSWCVSWVLSLFSFPLGYGERQV